MAKSSNSQETLQGLLICTAFSFALSILSYMSPASSWAVCVFQQRPIFFLALIAPPAIFMLFFLIRWIMSSNPDELQLPRPIVLLSGLLIWLLYAVLFTGGIFDSPLFPICGMVPLMSGRFFGESTRRSVLKTYLLGVILVGVVSLSKSVPPPSQYPDGMLWDIRQSYPSLQGVRTEVVITTVLMAIAISIEMALDRIASRPEDNSPGWNELKQKLWP